MADDWVLVTGASEGLGREFADIAAASGRGVILTARSEDKLHALADQLYQRHGAECWVIRADLSDVSEVDRLWAEASDGRRISILVNNAGLGRNGRFADDGWDRELASIMVNAVAATRLMKLAIPAMKEAGRGRILNVSSTAGFLAGPGMAVYHATKAYLNSLSEAVSHELRSSSISITTLAPGATATQFAADAGMEDIPLFKFGRPQSARFVAELGWQGMISGRRMVIPGVSNRAMAFLPRVLPTRLVSAVAARVLSRSGTY